MNVREHRRITNQQSREPGNIGYTKTKKNKKKTQHNICCTPLYANIAIFALFVIQTIVLAL